MYGECVVCRDCGLDLAPRRLIALQRFERMRYFVQCAHEGLAPEADVREFVLPGVGAQLRALAGLH